VASGTARGITRSPRDPPHTPHHSLIPPPLLLLPPPHPRAVSSPRITPPPSARPCTQRHLLAPGDPVKNGAASPRAGQARARRWEGQLRRAPLLEVLGILGLAGERLRAKRGGGRGSGIGIHGFSIPRPPLVCPMIMAEPPASVSSMSDLL
jgi:hypothetical protein